MRKLLAACLLAGAALGQPTTKIGPHHLGETFQEWMVAGSVDLSAICGPHKRNEAASYKQLCKGLSAIRDSGNGQADLKIADQRFAWKFVGGTVAEAEVHYLQADTEQQIKLLTDVYGPLAESKIVPYQNALGAKWDCIEARWALPDGAGISAVESIETLYGPPMRRLVVTFVSKEQIARYVSKMQPAVNPYAAK